MMLTFLLVVHVLVTLGMIACILLQRSEGGGFVSSASSFMTVRGSANFLTRLTAIFATAFILLSLLLAILAGGYKKNRSVILEEPQQTEKNQISDPSKQSDVSTSSSNKNEEHK